MNTTNILLTTPDTNNTNMNRFQVRVHFSTEIRCVTIPNRFELPCTQEYYANYAICKRQFIEQTYLIHNGSLVGFNYTLELQRHNTTEREVEREIEKEFPETNLSSLEDIDEKER